MKSISVEPLNATAMEMQLLKEHEVLGRQAPRCSLLRIDQMSRLMRAFGKHSHAKLLSRAAEAEREGRTDEFIYSELPDELVAVATTYLDKASNRRKYRASQKALSEKNEGQHASRPRPRPRAAVRSLSSSSSSSSTIIGRGRVIHTRQSLRSDSDVSQSPTASPPALFRDRCSFSGADGEEDEEDDVNNPNYGRFWTHRPLKRSFSQRTHNGLPPDSDAGLLALLDAAIREEQGPVLRRSQHSTAKRFKPQDTRGPLALSPFTDKLTFKQTQLYAYTPLTPDGSASSTLLSTPLFSHVRGKDFPALSHALFSAV
jgi:hypothetical protein